MTLKTLFQKPVDRPIEGVIKADDEASLRIEVEEYVLTNEVAKRLEAFLDAYNNYEGANGVWVSGFFGSGKSHLLKMLALLLENREVEGSPVLDMFLPKCGDNEILRGDLKRASAIPSRSILFNIDQKADVISKSQIDALLAVFVKVFDEMCGYYGKQGHIAQFERELDSRGLFGPFKNAYQSVAGRSWETGREQALLESKNIAKAYASVADGDEKGAVGLLDKYRSEYRVSIEDFAKVVDQYIQQQPANFRLNFFVDEVGQYIAENVKLMTNLQTIAESLATRCRGRAWVVVTAQEEMDTVVGEMTKQQSHDFSKIQARFSNRMPLTSQDVAEVIQKRLLTKNESGISELSGLYHDQVNNLKTLFDFADGSQTYRNFQDREHFIHCYPFIPYQFSLFQASIKHLSQHNAFTGKHSSVGERSMLGVFQQVAVHISDHRVGQLATFDLMFEGIRTALKGNIQRAILVAEKNLDSDFAIRVLKSLFLVKYIREFKPTIRNLCVLMLDSFDTDVQQLRKNVEEALGLLEQQTYIQRNGELYEYLTDEEKDVEQEIKNTEVDASDVAAELEKVIFEQVLRTRKIRYSDNNQDYPFSRKLDDKLYGREYELSIHVISPFHDQVDNIDILRANSAYNQEELLVVMPSDPRLVGDLLMYKRTEKYIRQNISITQQDTIKKILTSRSSQNHDRLSQIQQLVKGLLGKARLFVAGTEIEISSEDAQTCLYQGFHELITRAYPNLRMLRGINYTEADVAKYLELSDDGLFGNDTTALSESEQELLAFIQANQRTGIRTTLKTLIEKFETKPYGWYYAAILGNLALLCARGKVEVRGDSNILEGDDLERALRNTHAQGNLVLEPQVEFTASQVRALKDFYEDYFDKPPTSSEAKALGKETAEAFGGLVTALRVLLGQQREFPFLNSLEAELPLLEQVSKKDYNWFLTELRHQSTQLLDARESRLEPIRRFMAGPQKDIYSEARTFLSKHESNFVYTAGRESSELRSALEDPTCFRGPQVQALKGKLDHLKAEVSQLINVEKSRAGETIEKLKQRLETMEDFKALREEQRTAISRRFGEVISFLERQELIAVLRETARRFEEVDYQRVLADVAAQEAENRRGTYDPNRVEGGGKVKEKGVVYVQCRTLNVDFPKAWLESEDDTVAYLAAVKTAILEEIKKGHRVQI